MSKRRLPPGMTRRGGKYWSDFSHRGRRIRKPLSTDLEVSKVMLRKERLRVEAGELDNDHDFAELVERFFAERKQVKASTEQRYRDALATFQTVTNIRAVADITLDMAKRYREHRIMENGCGVPTVQWEIDRVTQVIKWGVKQELVHHNPIAALDRWDQTPEVPVGPFTLAEAEALIGVAPVAWADVFQVAFGTGLRIGELCGLRVEDVDLQADTISVPRRIAKTRSSIRTIPMIPVVREIVAYAVRGREPGDTVFRNTHGKPLQKRAAQNALDRYAREAGIQRNIRDADGTLTERRGFHSTRHSFTSWLAEAGVSKELLDDLTGHARSSVTDRYITFAADALREAVSKHPWYGTSTPHGQPTILQIKRA